MELMIFCFVRENEIFYLSFFLFEFVLFLIGIIWYLFDNIVFKIFLIGYCFFMYLLIYG